MSATLSDDHSHLPLMQPSTIDYLGHATLMIKLGDLHVLTDPVLSDRVLHLRRRGPSANQWLQRQPRPDVILISHLHSDHLHLPSLWRLPSDVPIILPQGAARWLRNFVVNPLIELDHGESLELRGTRIQATFAAHGGTVLPPTIDRTQGYLLDHRHTIYFPGDTDLFAEMIQLGDHGIDLALLPIWGWGPTLGKGHLDPHRAAKALQLLRPRTAIPIHWATFRPLGPFWEAMDYLHKPGHEFVRLAAEYHPQTNVQLLSQGQHFILT